MSGSRVLLMQLSQRTSAKGRVYMSGWLGKARVIGFPGESDQDDQLTWNIYVATPDPKPADATAKSAPAERREPMSQQRYIRKPRREPAADDGELLDDDISDIGR